jgi:ATP-dependent protease ClpP protease subunit
MPTARDAKINPVEPVKPDYENWWRENADNLGGAKNWWKVIRNGDIAHLFIGGQISFGNHWQQLSDEIGEASDIRLTITDCFGGDSLIALAFAEAFRGQVSCATITKRAASSGYIFALAGSKIKMERRATLLLHEPISFGMGGAKDLFCLARSLESVKKRLAALLIERTELPEDAVLGWLDGYDFEMTAEQALAANLVDEIYDQLEIIIPKPPAMPERATSPAVNILPAKSMPELTEDEEFVLEMLQACGRIKTNNPQNLLRELCAWATYNTDQEQKL